MPAVASLGANEKLFWLKELTGTVILICLRGSRGEGGEGGAAKIS